MILKSNDQKSAALSIFLIAVGLLFIYLAFRHDPWSFDLTTEVDQNKKYANLAGYLLVFIGSYALVAYQKVHLTLDESKKRIYMRTSSFLSSPSVEVASFESLSEIKTIKFGRTQHPFYMLVLVFKDRKPLNTNYWSNDEFEIKKLAQDIAQVVDCKAADVPRPLSDFENVQIAFISIVLALITWAIYYKIKFGATCAAMWFGTAPILFIFIFFMTYFRVLKYAKSTAS